jgi:hypothetical protein
MEDSQRIVEMVRTNPECKRVRQGSRGIVNDMKLACLQGKVPQASSGSKSFANANRICNKRRRVEQA